jgi:hypothetical protein
MSITHGRRTGSLLTGASIICAILAIAGIWTPELLLAGIVGALLGAGAILMSRGRRVNTALAGCAAIASLSMAIGGGLWHLTCYHTEAPPGVLRVDIKTVFPAEPEPSSTVQQFVGQSICLKGYAFPTGQISGIDSFLLTPDGTPQNMGQTIGVILRDGELWDWYEEALVVSGELMLNSEFEGRTNEPLYLLKNATVARSRTPLGLAPRHRSSGC